jgi:hypothetical protein
LLTDFDISTPKKLLFACNVHPTEESAVEKSGQCEPGEHVAEAIAPNSRTSL